HRVFIVFVVGNEDIAGISEKEALGIEQLQRAQATGHFPVEPGVEAAGLGIAGKLAQEVLSIRSVAGRVLAADGNRLIARSLAVVIILVVEAFAGQRDIVRVRMSGFA